MFCCHTVFALISTVFVHSGCNFTQSKTMHLKKKTSTTKVDQYASTMALFMRELFNLSKIVRPTAFLLRFVLQALCLERRK